VKALLPWSEQQAHLNPNAPALVSDAGTWSFAELAARARDRARRLRAVGVSPGDTVAAVATSTPDVVELFHALPLLGSAFAPLHPRHTPAELAHALCESGARWLLHPGGAHAEAALAAAREARARPIGPATLRRASASATPLRARVDPERPLALLATSGTTGPPRAAVLRHRSFLWNALATAAHLGARPGDRWLACMPLAHVGGLALLARAAVFGAAVVLHDRFDPERVSQSLDDDRIALASFVPTMLRRVLHARGDAPAPESLRAVLLGGAAAPPDLVREAWERGWPVLPTYGLTEACSQVATLPTSALGRRTDVAGRPLLGLEVSVCDEDDGPLPAGTPGEIAVRGPTVMAGYHGRPDATARALRGGWLRTGDLGALGADGWLRVLGRRDDLIVTGGENVAPDEVEAVLAAHPAVREAGVASEPDPDLGQRVAAWVVLHDGARSTARDLRTFCRDHLAGYKVPRAIHEVAELPRTSSGKLRRTALRELGSAGPPR